MISVRATKHKSRIYYSVQDEYSTEFKVNPKWSKTPLTCSQIINLIETTTDTKYGEQSLGLRSLDELYRLHGGGLDTCRSFVRITSAFYSELETCYEQAIEEWYQCCLEELLVDEKQ